ncbi:unnamed protein product [Leptidea sinapis]|uniref:C3H1-type domain-containing protein n=1 Tax=Leptidea sinapis TaxID=189913 RepID=A0A5E4PWF5_9NEOP|nr:unnamed protein product [Leptidea sinapis]
MMEPISNTDLEDGEIESDGENNENQEQLRDEPPLVKVDDKPQDGGGTQDVYFSRSGKKKKSKSSKNEQKSKDKSKKSRKYNNPLEDDFAGNIEKAIRKAMKKTDDGQEQNEIDVDERRKHKKRKKEAKEGSSKKRKKQEYQDEVDESEMMCVRGASPVQKQCDDDAYSEEDKDSYESDSSNDSRGHNKRSKRNRQNQRDKKSKNDRRRGNNNLQEAEGVCIYYMQGKCHLGDDCIYSHDANPPRKMELCKFYLMDCCAKRDKCLYMHSDFPCKYFHTGLPCIYKDDCKFAHGKPLNDALRSILLKHIESAPKEILGDFPRLNRDDAMKMIQSTQLKLKPQYSDDDNNDNNIPSLFDINIPHPQNLDTMQGNFNNDRQNKISPKIRQSRWQNENSPIQNFNVTMSPNSSLTNVLNIKNLSGVLTPRQISDLTKLGIENLDQLGQLTVLQLNSIGISLKQITEIQLNTMSIQKLGLINNTEPHQTPLISSGNKDLDLRVPPTAPVPNSTLVMADLPGQDVDMRFQPSVTAPQNNADSIKARTIQRDVVQSKDMIDIDQYTKDALKFASKDKENIDVSNDTYEHERLITACEIKDVDQRVLPYIESDPKIPRSSFDENTVRVEGDTDIRFLQPDPIFKSPPGKRNRRSTTDDDDENNLLIDEKWYSSDEEKGIKKKSPTTSPQMGFMSPPTVTPVIEPSAVLSKIGDLSKIDISEEVTKLLNTMKNNLHESTPIPTESANTISSRDPRSRRSPDKTAEAPKVTNKKSNRVSIYECVEGEPTDGRRRTDVDLRQTDFPPNFGDTDLRQSASGDIDLRLSLPFKPLPNYTPASEINGSINSHPPIPFKLSLVFIPRPDYTDIKNSTAKSQALVDPRLRKVFRLSVDESNSDSEKATVKPPVSTGPRIDPRRKPKEVETLEPKTNSLDLHTILQNSNWYKELSSTQKIFVNQHLAPITQIIKQYHQDTSPAKKFDIASIQSNTILGNIFTNLGVSLGENAEFTYLPKPKEPLLKTPVNPNPFAMTNNMNGPHGGIESNMNMMNGPPMGMGGMNNMNHLHGYNQQDHRGGPTPGLLGIAPNIPHGFAGPNNFGNMGYNGPMQVDFNFDGDHNFQRFSNRGGPRGRGNDRWNRGGSNRGQRDRKKFNERGGWKN